MKIEFRKDAHYVLGHYDRALRLRDLREFVAKLDQIGVGDAALVVLSHGELVVTETEKML